MGLPAPRGPEDRPIILSLRCSFGHELFTIGFCAYRSSAVDNSRDVYEDSAATPAHLERGLARARYRLGFFDLDDQGSWARREQTLRYNGFHDQVMVPAEQYDALILIADVPPPSLLY